MNATLERLQALTGLFADAEAVIVTPSAPWGASPINNSKHYGVPQWLPA